MKYIRPIVFSLFLFVLIGYFSLFLAWGRVLDVGTGLFVAALAGMAFFLIHATKELSSKGESGEIKPPSLFNYFENIVLIFFAFLFLTIGWFILSNSIKDKYKLYKYESYPCKDVVFKTVNKMNLVAHNRSYMAEGAYFITRNTLEEHQYYLDHRGNTEYIDKGEYSVGSEWEILGFYQPYGSTGGGLKYFLVQSIEDNNTAWIASMNFDYQQCQPNFDSYEKMYKPERNAIREIVDLTGLEMKPYK